MIHDPLGAALKDHLRGVPDVEVIVLSNVSEPENLSAELLFRSWEQMSDLEKIALDTCRGNVLDIGAGAGSHALILQARGLEVTCLDKSPGAAEVMRNRGLQKVRTGDFRNWRGSGYDTILMLMNGIGIVEDPYGLEALFLLADGWLNPGGQIITDSSDLRPLLDKKNLKALQAQIPKGQFYVIVDYQMEYRSQKGEAFSWIYFDYPTLKYLAGMMGFRCKKIAQGKALDYLVRMERAPG